jgi:cation diffusion facilitator CzcD-associated flavoprotein CzcO
VIERPDRPVSGLQRALRRFRPYAWLVRKAIYWALELRAYGFTVDPKRLAQFEWLALRHMKRQVADAALREALTPSYRMGCKRVLLSDDYYPALQRPSVELVTTPIRELRERTIVTADGAERAVDTLILGTGFDAADGVAPVKIYGRGGVELGRAWKDGMEAYLGISVAGFPNLFLLIGPNTGLGHNSMVFMIEAQIRYVMSALDYMRRSGVVALDVRHDAQALFNDRLQSRMARTVWASGCSSWYQNKSGKNTTLWPGFTFAYRFLTRRLDPARYEVVLPSASG